MTLALKLTFLLHQIGRLFCTGQCIWCQSSENSEVSDVSIVSKRTWHHLHCHCLIKPAHVVHSNKKKQTLRVVCKCYLRQVCCPCLVCLMLWAAAVCLTVAGYEDVGQASGSGDFCKGGYGTAVAAAASAQNKPASSVTGPGVGECRHMPN